MAKGTDWEVEIFDGMSISRLSQVFRLDRRTVQLKLAGCRPAGERDGHAVYHVYEAARYLVDPVIDIEEYVKRMKPSDLPMSMQDPWWSAQNKRLKFLSDSKQLWRTEKVLTVLTLAFRVLRQGILLFADTLDNRHGLTPEVRKSIEQMSDGLINELRDRLVNSFDVYNGRDDRETSDVLEAGARKANPEPEEKGIAL